MNVLAYREGTFYEVRYWMRYCMYYIFTIDGVSCVSPSDEFWEELKAKR